MSFFMSKIPTSRGLLGPILCVFWISHPRLNHGLAPIPHPTHLGNRTGDRGSKYRIEKTAVLMPIIGKKVGVKGGGGMGVSLERGGGFGSFWGFLGGVLGSLCVWGGRVVVFF